VAQVAAGQKIRASQWNEVDAVGFVGEHLPTASVTSTGTTEKVACFVTFTAVAGRRYRAEWEGDLSSSGTTVACVTRMRYKATASSTDVTGTLIDQRDSVTATASNAQCNMKGSFLAPTSDTYTVVATINAASGTGNAIQAYGATAHTPSLTINCTKGV
jgi:hypothetical protein